MGAKSSKSWRQTERLLAITYERGNVLSVTSFRHQLSCHQLSFASLAAAAIGCAGTPTPATLPVMTPTNPGTTPGAYTITVTGTSGGVTQSTAVTVAVN